MMPGSVNTTAVWRREGPLEANVDAESLITLLERERERTQNALRRGAFVMSTCNFIHVLDFGQLIATGTPAEVQANAIVQAAYLGAVSEGAA